MMSMTSLPQDLPSIAVPLFLKRLDSRINELSDQSFPLFDECGLLLVQSNEEFTGLFDCRNPCVKVISLFEVPKEMPRRDMEVLQSNLKYPSNVGVWAALNIDLGVLVLDIRGQIDIKSEGSCTNLLLKVFAISDVIIYKTNEDCVSDKLLKSIANASDTYMSSFVRELQNVSERLNIDCPLSDFGPSVIIHHDAMLENSYNKSKLERILRKRNYRISAFSSVAPSFCSLNDTIRKQLEVVNNRSARSLVFIYQFLEDLEAKFSSNTSIYFPDSYFTCNVFCQSCKSRCIHNMNHVSCVPHESMTECLFQEGFNNLMLLCRKCHDCGDTVQIQTKTSCPTQSSWLNLVKNTWTGYQHDCPNCGVIYRSREFWYGNKDVRDAVIVGRKHVWPEESENNRNVVSEDGSFKYISGLVSTALESVTNFVSDRFRPSSWVPKDMILDCGICKRAFGPLDHKHHCRSCGHGFCEDCSSKTRSVPERGWGTIPVKVCDKCVEVVVHDDLSTSEEVAVTVRKVSVVIQNAVGSVVHTAVDKLSSGINAITVYGPQYDVTREESSEVV